MKKIFIILMLAFLVAGYAFAAEYIIGGGYYGPQVGTAAVTGDIRITIGGDTRVTVGTDTRIIP